MEAKEVMKRHVITERVHHFADLVVGNRSFHAMESGVSRYPIFRRLNFAARIELEALMDAMALDTTWRVERQNGQTLFIDG